MRNGGFSIVSWPIGDDQVGAVDRLVHVVALGQRGGAHLELGAAGAPSPLPIWVLKNGMPVRRTNSVRPAGQARPAGGGAEHHQRPLGRQDHLGGAVERGRRARPAARSGAAAPAARPVDLLAGDVLGQLEVHRPGPLLRRHAERVAHQGRDAGGADDLARRAWSAASSSRPCRRSGSAPARLLMIAFWPVIMIIGIAPRWA